MTPRIVILTNMIAPYRIPLFNRIAEQAPGFHVIFLVAREKVRAWKVPVDEIHFSYEVLPVPTGMMARVRSLVRFNPHLIGALRRARPDVLLIGGWGYVEMWAALAYTRLFGVRRVMWGGGTPAHFTRKSRIVHLMRKFFVRSMDSFVTYGSAASELFRSYGVPANRIVTGFNTGDVNFYRPLVEQFRRTDEYTRMAQDYPRPLFLYVGQFVPGKGIMLLLQALSELEQRPGLILVGGGEEKALYERFCQEHNLNVTLVDFQQRENLAKYFAIADAFVFPTLRDQGAIVLSEALCSGLFTIASKYDGIAADLIDVGETGILIDPTDPEALKRQLADALTQWQRWDKEAIAAQFMGKQPIERYANAMLKSAALATEDQTHENRD